MANKKLPVISNCDNCGACCMHMGTPPGYSLFFPPRGKKMPAWAKKCDDWRIFQKIPKAIRAKLADYYRRMWSGKTKDRTADDDTPCLWFDPATRKCRHHEHRPTTCREFEVGSESCREHRHIRGIG